MTHPSEIKPREGDHPGTRADAFIVGAELPPVQFTVTPDIIEAYRVASGMQAFPLLDGRPAGPVTVLGLYQMAILHRRFPPPQGIVLAEQEWWWWQPLWADEDTRIQGSGTILEQYEKRGKQFLRWRAEFHRADEMSPLAAANSTIYLPY